MNYQQGYGAPIQQKRGMGTGTIVLIVFGVIMLLGLGAVGLFCAAVGSSIKKDDADKKTQSEARADLIAGLGQLAANPKSQKSTSKDDKESTKFAYEAPASWGVQHLTMTIPKDQRGAWQLSFDSPKKLSARNFGPPDALTTMNMPDDWFDIDAGPLKGALLHLKSDAGAADVMSPAFLLSASFSDDRRLVSWACDTGRGGLKAITASDFLDQCRDGVRSKLLIPDSADFHFLGVAGEIATTRDCSRSWTSDVTSKNAFGVEIKHGFSCSYATKPGHVEVALSK